MATLRLLLTASLLAAIVTTARATATQLSTQDANAVWFLLIVFCIVALVTLGTNEEWK